ncbi:MAG: TetR/AcrR family transcriptional regulator [Acidimicrobiales bacterium]|nr:TetR/AcrR family transcriptional regulator [Acidimicrobiales bacterium]
MPIRGRTPQRPEAPHGRSAVKRALLDAGRQLFAVRGPNSVSVRELAAVAGVNHGLVHRYFGSKDGLLGAVLDDLAHQIADTVTSELQPIDLDDSTVDAYWRVLARAILDGRDPATLQSDFPTVRALVAKGRADGHSPSASRERAAHVLALELGWRMFKPFLAAATGLRLDDPGVARRSLNRAVGRLLHPAH